MAVAVDYAAAGEQALNQLSRLPFDNIIGGPLNAAIKAQAQAAETTVDFIHSVGMREVNGVMQAINVQFVYQDSSGLTRRITVPILAIIPIPFIVIDSVAISFKAKITASTAAQSSQSKAQAGYVRGYAAYRGTRFRAALSAGYSAKKDSKASQESKYAVEYTMDVEVHASQTGLTAGMEAVLGFLQQGTHELPVAVQARVLGLDSSYSSKNGPFKRSFNLVLSDASGQPIDVDPTKIIISSADGRFSGKADDGPGAGSGASAEEDGFYGITFDSAKNIDADIADDLIITITALGDETVLTLPVAVKLDTTT